MGIKRYKPTVAGAPLLRGRISSEVTKKAPEKSAARRHEHSTGGRNNYGRITSRFRGGGHKRRYRIIDFKRDKIGVPAKVASIEYDPNRTRAHRAARTTPTARRRTSSRPTASRWATT